MNTQILILKNGDALVGQVETEIDLTDNAQVILYHPMYIVQTVSDSAMVGFKLEDALLFSSDDHASIRPSDILYVQVPSEQMVVYFDCAIEFNAKAVRPVVTNQICEATTYMQEALGMIKDGKSKRSRFARTSLN